jgi:tetraacyldisaccharide 4'-kinase
VNPWRGAGPVAWLLWPASLVFRCVVAVRRLCYRLGLFGAYKAGIPVIVVGNVTVGGSGKTPLVLHVAEALRRGGWKPGIVSRGYGGSLSEPCAATIASDPAEVGDEPMLLARHSGCPVWVHPERIVACRILREENPECDVIVADDGLQHYALARELEICVVDERGFGNGMLLPAGPLRESRSRLHSVDAIVRHGASGSKGFKMTLEGDALVNLANAGERRPAKSFAGQKVHAVAGIGHPQRFFRQLASFGIQVIPHPFPDHHPFQAGDLAFDDALPIVMTEKDAVKCKRFITPRHWVFPVVAVLDPAFGTWLLEKLGGRKTA